MAPKIGWGKEMVLHRNFAAEATILSQKTCGVSNALRQCNAA